MNGGECSVDFLDHDYKELEIPPLNSEAGGYQVEPEALHIWPRGGYMLIALPNQDGSFTVTLFMPKQGEISFEKLENADQLNAFFEAEFPSAKRLIPDLESDFFANRPRTVGDGSLLKVVLSGKSTDFRGCFSRDRTIPRAGNEFWV